MTHLWDIEHSYYCEDQNWRGNGGDDGIPSFYEYDSWKEFYDVWGNADEDMNLIFRWDWKKKQKHDPKYPEEPYRHYDLLCIYWMLQRKGDYRITHVKVKRRDEKKVIEFLKPRWDYMKFLWAPIHDFDCC